MTRLLIGWIEAGLSGDLPAPGAGPDLAARVQALEAAVAQLQAQGPAPRSPERVSRPIPRTGEALSPERVSLVPRTGDLPSPAGGIPTAELADRTGTNRAGWNNWAVKAAPGAVRHHPQAGAWRLLGKGPGPNGGPDRWLWEPA